MGSRQWITRVSIPKTSRPARRSAHQARILGPAELKIATQRVVDRIDPDGTLPDDERIQQARDFRMSRQADGSVKGEFRLTPEVGEKLKAVLDPLAAPRSPA